MKRFVLLALLLAGCSRPEPEERYGFVALLGRDTISVERVTRQGNKVTSDEVTASRSCASGTPRSRWTTRGGSSAS